VNPNHVRHFGKRSTIMRPVRPRYGFSLGTLDKSFIKMKKDDRSIFSAYCPFDIFLSLDEDHKRVTVRQRMTTVPDWMIE
jgi:hypothetical protein